MKDYFKGNCEKWIGRFAMDSPGTSYGATLTYTEKYFLLKFFNVPTDEEDPDLKILDTISVKEESKSQNKPEQKPEQKPESKTDNKIDDILFKEALSYFKEAKTVSELKTHFASYWATIKNTKLRQDLKSAYELKKADLPE